MKNWRAGREYRLWRILTIRRDKACQVCGTIKHRQAHHLDSGQYHPEGRYDLENSVTLCQFHHTLLHCSYKNSFREKCTKKDYLNFIELLTKVEKHRIKD